MQARQWPERRPAWPSSLASPDASCELGEALVISRHVIPDGLTPAVGRARVSGPAWLEIADPLLRSVVMVTVAAFAILVLLPAPIAAQATTAV
jgi:hypothetical protein